MSVKPGFSVTTLKRSILLFISLLFSVQVYAVPPEQIDGWKQDLAFYASQLKKNHIDLFHSRSKQSFDAELKAIEGGLSESTPAQITAQLMRLTHSLGDGHTAMPLWGSEPFRYPFIVNWVEGKALLTGVEVEHAGLLGSVILSMDSTPVDEVYDTLKHYVPFVENRYSEAVRVALYMRSAQLMQALGLTKDVSGVSLRLKKPDGQLASVTLDAVATSDFASSVNKTIAYHQDLSELEDVITAQGVWFVQLPEDAYAYIRIDGYPGLDEMTEFAGAVHQAMAESSQQNLVIDFRGSYGGDFFMGLLLANYLVLLDSIDWLNGVYVLTSGTTFSAAMSNAAQYSDILNAKRVGEPTGATPCGYQDMGQFNLPNSGLLVSYSKRHYCFAEPVEDALQPDVPVSVKLNDFLEGRDRALEWVKADIIKRNANNVEDNARSAQ